MTSCTMGILQSTLAADHVIQLDECINRAQLRASYGNSSLLHLSSHSGVSAHAVNVFGFDLNMCRAINQPWKLLVE